MNSENRTSDNLEEHVSGVQRLAEALVQAKLKSVEHDDSVAELRETGRIRLELLKQELAEVFAAVPNDDPYWDFAMSYGMEARLWLDATAHIAMGRDRRSYRFIRDTRAGRVVLCETAHLPTIVQAATNYIADRIVERQKLIESDTLPLKVMHSEPSFAETADADESIVISPSNKILWRNIMWFCVGVVIALLVLMVLFYEKYAGI